MSRRVISTPQVAQWRRFHGLTLKELASRVGLSIPTIWKIENQQINPRLEIAEKIAKELHMPLDAIFRD